KAKTTRHADMAPSEYSWIAAGSCVQLLRHSHHRPLVRPRQRLRQPAAPRRAQGGDEFIERLRRGGTAPYGPADVDDAGRVAVLGGGVGLEQEDQQPVAVLALVIMLALPRLRVGPLHGLAAVILVAGNPVYGAAEGLRLQRRD